MNRTSYVVALVASLYAAGSAEGASPTVKWTYDAQSTLYASPVVVDVYPSPACETIISDAEVRTLRCIDATGKQIWAYRGGWRTRLTSRAAVSTTARPGRSTLAIGGSDGRLCCLDAETGKEHWVRTVDSITWGAATWTDLDGDGRDEVVAGTADAVIALDADGKTLWTYRRAEGPRLETDTPLAVCDVDGDRKPEVFVVDRLGPFCLNADGSLRWQCLRGDGPFCAPVVADVDGNGQPELYTGADRDPLIIALHARTGRAIWSYPTLAGPCSVALGDINRDGDEEMVAADVKGNVYALRHHGELMWSFRTAQSIQAEVTLGDVDGDDDIEVLVASWDHYLYCLDSAGNLEWRCAAERRVLGPATIADVDGDGKTDMLFGGSDHVLRCISLGGAYDATLIPWPSSRFDARQSGAAFPRTVTPSAASIDETRSLLGNGGFEQAHQVDKPDRYPKGSDIRKRRLNRPRGWYGEAVTSTDWRLDREVFRSGAASVRVARTMRLASAPVIVEGRVCAVRATVYGKGRSALGAILRWSGRGGVLREDFLEREGERDGWARFVLPRVPPPVGTRWVTLICETGAGGAWWDDAEIVAAAGVPPKVSALVNQVGYDVGAPKRFTVQSNFKARKATFAVVRDDGTEAFTGSLEHRGRIKGHFGHDWGHEYYRGDFSGLDAPGSYRIRVTLDAVVDMSWAFEIGADVIWKATVRPAYRFFTYQRCGVAVPGYHGACHLDDGLTFGGKHYDLSGGWHDAGDYSTYHNAPYVYGLARAYGLARPAFDRHDKDGNGRSDFLDEILWGADHSRRMIAPDGSAFGQITSGHGFWGPPELETDNKPGTGDERPVRPPKSGCDSSVHHAAMAKVARYVKKVDRVCWVDAADRGLRWAIKSGKRGTWQFSTAVDLYAATGDKRYAEMARTLMPKITADETVVDAVRNFDALLKEDHSGELRKVLVDYANGALDVADNPFGVWTFGPRGKPNFFGTPSDGDGWRVGTNHHLPRAASLVALAYRYEPDPRYLAFVYDQLNWILGNNPYDVSLMEGAGDAFVPTYHNRLTFAGVARGAIPGSVINGITCRRAGEDVPYLDMTGVDLPAFQSNECWLPHNTSFLNALVNLQAARQRRPSP